MGKPKFPEESHPYTIVELVELTWTGLLLHSRHGCQHAWALHLV